MLKTILVRETKRGGERIRKGLIPLGKNVTVLKSQMEKGNDFLILHLV